jgi:hypothetical protein
VEQESIPDSWVGMLVVIWIVLGTWAVAAFGLTTVATTVATLLIAIPATALFIGGVMIAMHWTLTQIGRAARAIGRQVFGQD